ncbi:Uncharacterised protein [Mycobacterium tuberculosis]|nr:Uncharacterised protein [Mycobacterium tuberculosis]
MVGKLALGSESSRQTQNPERGRKPASGKSVRSKRFQRVVRPKTPRGDGNSKSSTTSAAAACSRSRQTQNPERGRKREEPSHLGLPPAGRQTQNPERGRKLNNTFFERGAVESVVRPKTPRGYGNTETQHQPDNLILASSDPKPREGTETPSDAGTEVDDKPSSDPKPREGTETSTPSVPHTGPVPCRQTQNPERGRKPDGTELSGFYQVVVRPKTPRGDGNPHGGTWTSATIGVVRPKTPRGDGNWTQNRTGCGRCSSRQTQNPERGRKRISPATPQPRYCSMSSDPKPREGTETHRR